MVSLESKTNEFVWPGRPGLSGYYVDHLMWPLTRPLSYEKHKPCANETKYLSD